MFYFFLAYLTFIRLFQFFYYYYYLLAEVPGVARGPEVWPECDSCTTANSLKRWHWPDVCPGTRGLPGNPTFAREPGRLRYPALPGDPTIARGPDVCPGTPTSAREPDVCPGNPTFARFPGKRRGSRANVRFPGKRRAPGQSSGSRAPPGPTRIWHSEFLLRKTLSTLFDIHMFTRS